MLMRSRRIVYQSKSSGGYAHTGYSPALWRRALADAVPGTIVRAEKPYGPRDWEIFKTQVK